MKLAIIDIDGVIVNCTKRIEAATTDGKIDWEKALNSNALHLDELIEHAVENLAMLRQHYDHQIVLLTSRYDHMRQASLIWLNDHGVTGYDRAIFKAWDTERFKKTKVWKAEQVVKLLQEIGLATLWNNLEARPVTELLIIEDNESNQQEINDALNENMQLFEFCVFRSSLQEAVEFLEKGITR